jgi:hypothetical protein
VRARCGAGALLLAPGACVALVIGMLGAAEVSVTARRGSDAVACGPAIPCVEAVVECPTESESESEDGEVDPRARWIAAGQGRGPPI